MCFSTLWLYDFSMEALRVEWFPPVVLQLIQHQWGAVAEGCSTPRASLHCQVCPSVA